MFLWDWEGLVKDWFTTPDLVAASAAEKRASTAHHVDRTYKSFEETSFANAALVRAAALLHHLLSFR